MKDSAVGAILDDMVGAKTKPDYMAVCHALERVITHSHVLIPQWFSGTHRMAYNAWRLQKPAVTPPYFRGRLGRSMYGERACRRNNGLFGSNKHLSRAII